MRTHNHLLKRVIFLFILVLIPLITVGSLALHKNDQRQKEQILSSTLNTSDTYITHMDDSLKQVYLTNLDLVDQHLIRNLSVLYPLLSDWERSSQINLLRNQLYNTYAASPFLESAHAYFFDYQMVFNSNYYKYGSFRSLTEEECNFYQNLACSKGSIQYYTDPTTGEETLSVFMTPSSGSENYAVNLLLSQSQLHRYLESSQSFDEEYYIFHLGDTFLLTDVPAALEAESLSILKNFQNNKILSWQRVKLNGRSFYAFPHYSEYFQGTYLRLIPENILLKSSHYSYYMMIIFFLFVFLACTIFFAGIYKIVHKPFVTLTDAFEELEQGNFQVQIPPGRNEDFSYLFHAFNNMSVRLQELIERDYNQKMLLQKAELKQLQAQINPHFLYNSFFMLQRLIKTDVKEAQEVAQALASCFRYITKNSMDNVTLKEEYDYARNYVYIQGLRFVGRIRIELAELPVPCRDIPVPKLILQPILENAFKYGLNNKIENGLVQVDFLLKDDYLLIRMEDNGDELTLEALETLQNQLEKASLCSDNIEMSGLLNIQRRLRIFSHSEDSLRVSKSPLGGLCVEIQLQMKKEK